MEKKIHRGKSITIVFKLYIYIFLPGYYFYLKHSLFLKLCLNHGSLFKERMNMTKERAQYSQ